MKIWLIKIGEPLPWLDGEQQSRLWRAGQLADYLSQRGHQVTFWGSKFDHYKKEFRDDSKPGSGLGPETILLKSRGYKKNISIDRVMDHRDLANDFKKNVSSHIKPDLIIAAWPTIELAYAALKFGILQGIPVVLDIRDCWPDIIYNQFPNYISWVPKLALPYEHMANFSFSNATAITAVSQGLLTWAHSKGSRSQEALKYDRVFYQSQHDYHIVESYNKFWQEKGIELTADDKIRIVWAGSLEPTLDLKTCLSAIKKFSEHDTSSIEFIFCGRGSMEQKVMDMSREMNNLIFAGFVGEQELKALLEKSDLGFMCYPDRFDFHASIPNKVVDYCMAGLRVITNLHGELSTIMPQSEMLYYPSGDVGKLATVFDEVCKEREWFKTKSGQNRLLFEKKFDATSVLPSFCAHVERIGKKHILVE